MKRLFLFREVLNNRKEKEEIKTLIRKVLDSLNLRNLNLKSSEKLIIFYTESDTKNYISYKNSIKGLSRRLYSPLRRTSLGRRIYSVATNASKFEFKFINLAFPVLETEINLTKLTKNFFFWS
uniref:Uncharacterized protein n=1 Tax=Inonotus obliquus TaxID=167356 RepID=A0A5A4U7I7_9AGAM|nr:hypothetical protein [Inonotus obliquus]BBN21295.1 hypothetical protein [Inonotus obliquus]